MSELGGKARGKVNGQKKGSTLSTHGPKEQERRRQTTDLVFTNPLLGRAGGGEAL